MTKFTKHTAARLMVRQFERVPKDWVQIVSDRYGNGFRYVGFETMYIVSYPGDASSILGLMSPVTDPDDEMFGAMRVGDLDIYGWNIGKDEVNAYLVLGLNGIDPIESAFEKTWESLYDLLDYDWHERE